MSSCRAARGCGGFTVIELAAVIAVTVVVVALAYSAWRTHVVRGQVADALARAEPFERAIVGSFRASGDVPATAADLREGPRPTEHGYLDSISVESGRIDLSFGDRADAAIAGRRLSLTPHETAGADVVWLCGNQIPGPGLRPLGFAGGGRQAVQIATTIEARYLPHECR